VAVLLLKVIEGVCTTVTVTPMFTNGFEVSEAEVVMAMFPAKAVVVVSNGRIAGFTEMVRLLSPLLVVKFPVSAPDPAVPLLSEMNSQLAGPLAVEGVAVKAIPGGMACCCAAERALTLNWVSRLAGLVALPPMM